MWCFLSSNPAWDSCPGSHRHTSDFSPVKSNMWCSHLLNGKSGISYSGVLLQATMDPFRCAPSDYLLETHPLFLGSSFLRRSSPGTSPTEIKHFHQPGGQDHILFNNNSIKDCTCYFELPPLLYCGCCHIQAWRCVVPYSSLSLYVMCARGCRWLHVDVFIYIFVEVLSRKSHYQNMRSISNKNFQANMFWSWKTKGKSDSF